MIVDNKVYVGDVGTLIDLDTLVDISTGSVFTIKVKKPDGSTVDWTGALQGTTVVRYAIQGGDLDIAGDYKLQAHVVMPSWTGRGETVVMEVFDTFR